ncbi:MAG: NUDIX hydrolase [Candidatus Krumholzibacteriia bacterium]
MSVRPFEFCPLCGRGLVERMPENEDRVRRVCDSCGYVHYENPTPAAGVIVVEDGRVLLVKRKYEPKAGLWTLPAGFVESGEDAGACAVREAKEETNLDVEVVRLFDVYSALDDPRATVVLILYLCRRTGGELACGDDAVDARFFALDSLPDGIAFRAHRNALRDIQAQAAEGRL